MRTRRSSTASSGLCSTRLRVSPSRRPFSLSSRSATAPRIRARRDSSPARSSARSGTASSAAAEGVGARRSAAKSQRVKSVSCPTAEITGIREAATARTTASSLNGQRSSAEPPPRPRMISSAQFRRFMRRRASTIWGAAPSPCTSTGQNTTRAAGQRRARTVRMSWTAAPVGDVMTPTVSGNLGSGFFRPAEKRPSFSSFALSCSNARLSAPTPSG